MAADGSESLATAFRRAQGLFDAIENSKANSADAKFQTLLDSTIAQLEGVTAMIRQVELFSLNEELEDVSTPSLKYLLTPYYLGVLVFKKTGDRLPHVVKTKEYLSGFLAMCRQLGLVDAQDVSSLKAIPTGIGQPRDVKIARYKRDKEVKAALAKFDAERVREAGHGDDTDAVEGVFEEREREYTLLRIASAVHESVDLMATVHMEQQVLAHMAKLQRGEVEPTPPPEPRNSKMPANFVLLSERERLRRGVFKPHYSLPTFTVEEFMEKEMAEMGFEGRVQGGDSSGAGSAADAEGANDGKEDTDDKDVRKQREWDAWKDEHPAGAGNRYNRS